MKRDAFKPYDIRGRVQDELNEEMTYRIGWRLLSCLPHVALW